MSLSRLSTLISSAILAVGVVASNSTCYYPNGDANNGGVCSPNAEVSVCCGPTFKCLSNGLCQVGPDTRRTYTYEFYRSGCTDPTFESSSCPQMCTGTGNSNDRGQGVQKCSDNTYCCATSGDCCTDATNVFTLGAVSAIATISPSSSTTPTTSITSSTITSSSITSSSITSSTAVGTPSPAATSASAQGKDHTKSLAIGLGVGLSIGGLLLVALGVLHLLRRRAKKARTEANLLHGNGVSEMDSPVGPWQTHSAYSPTAKKGFTSEERGALHEIGNGRNEQVTAAHEMDTYSTHELAGSEPYRKEDGLKSPNH